MGKDFLEVLTARDVSVGGVAVFVAHGFVGCDIAEELELVVKLPGRRPFLARGIVRHLDRRHSVFGVEFVDLPEHHVGALAGYVEELSSRGQVTE